MLSAFLGSGFETLPRKAAPPIVNKNHIFIDFRNDANVARLNSQSIERRISPTDRAGIGAEYDLVAELERISSIVHSPKFREV